MLRIDKSKVSDFEIIGCDAVRKASAECKVLLKNDKNILPLKEIDKVALYGSGARKTVKGRTGSGDVNVRHFVSVEEGIQNAGVEITTTSWLNKYDEICLVSNKNFFKKQLKKPCKEEKMFKCP